MLVPEVSTRGVPAATLLEAVPELDEPAVAAVEKLSTLVEAAQVVLEVDGVTVKRVHVVAAPLYEVIVILGLQAAGAQVISVG